MATSLAVAEAGKRNPDESGGGGRGGSGERLGKGKDEDIWGGEMHRKPKAFLG